MVERRLAQVRIPQKTYDRLVEFAKKQGVTGPTGKPIVSQVLFKMIKVFLATGSDEEWERLREEAGGDTFAMVDIAISEYKKKLQRVKF